MSLLRGNNLLIALSISCVAYCGYLLMQKKYQTDMGNGVVIYADAFVRTGKWVFTCGHVRLVSLTPIPFPASELERIGQLKADYSHLFTADVHAGQEALESLTRVPAWHQRFHYRYSALSENSQLSGHSFGYVHDHRGRQWAVDVWQSLQSSSRFSISITPYSSDNYVDHKRALTNAVNSCPKPQQLKKPVQQ